MIAALLSISSLRDAGARGEIADVTGRLSGEKIEIKFPGRRLGGVEAGAVPVAETASEPAGATAQTGAPTGVPSGDSKLRLLKISALRGCARAGDIHRGDLLMVFSPDGEVLHSQRLCPIFGSTIKAGSHSDARPVSSLRIALFSLRWRKAAGVKVLREPSWLPFRYTKREVLIPMRDGVRLYTAIYEPCGVKNAPKCSTPQGLGVGGASKTAKNAAALFRSRADRGSAPTVARRGHSASTTVARIDSSEPGWHSHPYRLTLAVCPTKNPDRYEWMAEKATEVGLDVLVPVIGDRSERKVLGKEERLTKILLSAAKQSLKGAVPQLAAPVSVRDFIASLTPAASAPGIAAASAAVSPLDCQNRPKTLEAQASEPGFPSKSAENASRPAPTPSPAAALAPIPGATPAAASSLRLIAYCSDEVQPRASIMALLRDFWEVKVQNRPKMNFDPLQNQGESAFSPKNELSLSEVGAAPAGATTARATPADEAPSATPAPDATPEIIVLIGPEGDFSPEEVRAAIAAGFIPVSLGASRLRTETAAVTAAEAVYLSLL